MEQTRYYVEAGWDPALHTYYGQVWATIDPRTGEPPDHPVLWVGTRDAQAPTIGQLRDGLGTFAPLLEDELELEIERAIKEGIVDEDELDEVLDGEPTTEQLRGYLFRCEYRRGAGVASLERARARRDAAEHSDDRRRGSLGLFSRTDP